jgi:PilZ domain
LPIELGSRSVIWLYFQRNRALMQKFEYRSPRFTVDFPAQFAVEGLTLTGRCREISQEGMTLEIRQPLPLNSSGMVSLQYREQIIEIRARVAHVAQTHCGLEFLCEAETERNALAHLIASLTSAQGRPGPVLLT